MFTLLCCADLAGDKVNLEITLDAFPATLPHLESDIARIFNQEAQELAALESCTSLAEPFQLRTVFIYDDVLLRWTTLESLSQLHEYDQLYVFQTQTEWHVDIQKELPPPRPPSLGRICSIGGASSAYALPCEGGTASCTRSRCGADARASAAADVDAPQQSFPTRSPVRAQLEEQRREEERLARRLSAVRSERERLEREAQREEEVERRRRVLETDRLLKRKEEEIWLQRSALARAEEEFQRYLAEKQRLMERFPAR
ncbi:hypothetical protein LSCM1_00132 [Leishmania martiniquensis]|uniref:BILBO1 N-terminal domain-containing protein n=1 Tax=Leishmania martiniquensis TaxID=1580590 RepID=A0A836K8I1_9TRYP|nr:hypothetical protein LSCM1_00132 [Leishmania martiniquensis]